MTEKLAAYCFRISKKKLFRNCCQKSEIFVINEKLLEKDLLWEKKMIENDTFVQQHKKDVRKGNFLKIKLLGTVLWKIARKWNFSGTRILRKIFFLWETKNKI